MICQEVRTKEYIKRFTVSKFQMAQDISVVCDKELKDILLGSVENESFKEVNICEDNNTNEYIVSRVTDVLVVEPAKNETGIYKLIDADYIIVAEADKLSPDALKNFLEQRTMWVFAESLNGAVFKDLQFLEFGGQG